VADARVGVTDTVVLIAAVASLAGGVLWSIGLTMADYALGSRIPDVDHYLLPIVALVLVAPTSRSPWSCVAPAAAGGHRSHRMRRAAIRGRSYVDR
jgi:hypothetical protein